MNKCLCCGRDVVSEYDSQICMRCAGELPAPAAQKLSLRNILTSLHLLRPTVPAIRRH
jgi:hypothetical protein